jgi:N-acetylmuramoyl-L-alanine amidase
MSKLKKYSISLVFVICLLCVFLCGSALAEETDNGVSCTETPIYVDGLLSCRGYMIGDSTYVSLEAACAVLGYDADADYNLELNELTVEVAGITINVGFDDEYLCANGRYLYIPDGYMAVDGSFIIPVEALAKIFTLDVSNDGENNAINLSTADEQILQSGDEYYNDDDIYWMSRIITWESGNQPVAGQIGVGNVILNRAGDSRFGATIKDVIFQSGQFSVVSSGAIYGDPYDISVVCAKLVYEGYNTVGDALFFQTGRYWGSGMIETTWLCKIGDHNFFK